jgi:hypothetical protein
VGPTPAAIGPLKKIWTEHFEGYPKTNHWHEGHSGEVTHVFCGRGNRWCFCDTGGKGEYACCDVKTYPTWKDCAKCCAAAP